MDYFTKIKGIAEERIASLKARIDDPNTPESMRDACRHAIAVEEQTIHSCNLVLAKRRASESR